MLNRAERTNGNALTVPYGYSYENDCFSPYNSYLESLILDYCYSHLGHWLNNCVTQLKEGRIVDILDIHALGK